MSRTIIYRTPPAPIAGAGASTSTYRFGGPAPAASPTAAAPPAPPVDAFGDKLLKFVPAEVVAFFVPLASLVQDRPVLLVTTGVLGLAATPIYLWIAAKKLDAVLRPPLHNYVLSTLAFIVWAFATSKLGVMVGLDPISTAFALGVTVFVIPLVDGLLAPKS